MCNTWKMAPYIEMLSKKSSKPQRLLAFIPQISWFRQIYLAIMRSFGFLTLKDIMKQII